MSGERPTLIYDHECGFCTWAAEWVAEHGDVDIVGFDELTATQIDRLPHDWRDCAHLLDGDDVYSCGAAMEEAFLRTEDRGTPVVRTLRHLPWYGRVRERAYQFVADHRSLFGSFVS